MGNANIDIDPKDDVCQSVLIGQPVEDPSSLFVTRFLFRVRSLVSLQLARVSVVWISPRRAAAKARRGAGWTEAAPQLRTDSSSSVPFCISARRQPLHRIGCVPSWLPCVIAGLLLNWYCF